MVATTTERTIEAQIRSATRIEPDRLPRLKLLGDEWAAAAAARLGEFCASPVAAECLGVASLTLGPGAAVAKDASLCLTLGSDRWQGAGFALADAAAGDLFAEAIFGGTGKGAAAAPAPRRPSTSLDRRLTRKGLEAVLEAANPVFEAVAPLDMRVAAAIGTDIAGELDDLLETDNRAFVAFRLKLVLGDLGSVATVAVPEKAFATHRRALATVPERPAPASDEAWARNIQEGLQHTDLAVRAFLDERQITLGEVACFAVGQTIVLDSTMESLIVVECEEQRLFRGRMGMSRDAYVVRIEERIDPTEEFIDDILAD